MYSLEEELDTMVLSIAQDWNAPSDCGCRCGCASCAGADEAATARRPVAAPGQTPPRAVGTQLPGWRGWTLPVPLNLILDARTTAQSGGTVSARLQPFVAPGPQVYRITRQGIDRARALNIGLTKNVNSIADRMLQHYRQQSKADRNVFDKISGLPAERILVQAARIASPGLHPREAKAYENWLQLSERPLLYDADSTSFDEAAHWSHP